MELENSCSDYDRCAGNGEKHEHSKLAAVIAKFYVEMLHTSVLQQKQYLVHMVRIHLDLGIHIG